MSQRGLEALLRPKSIAVIGASMKPQRAGYLMMRNLLAGGFSGPVLPVTPAWKAVQGVLAWPDIDSLPFTPDLAVLCTNARRNLELLEAQPDFVTKPLHELHGFRCELMVCAEAAFPGHKTLNIEE